MAFDSHLFREPTISKPRFRDVFANVHRVDAVVDLAVLLPYDDHKIPCALIETENETIRQWISDRIDDYRDRSERVSLADLTE